MTSITGLLIVFRVVDRASADAFKNVDPVNAVESAQTSNEEGSMRRAVRTLVHPETVSGTPHRPLLDGTACQDRALHSEVRFARAANHPQQFYR